MRASTVEIYGEAEPPPHATVYFRGVDERIGPITKYAMVETLWRRAMRAIDIAVDGQRIAGTLVSPAPLIPGVLFVHGWGGSQEQYLARAREIAALGCVCLTFDLRGHAETEPQHETVTREDNLRDVLAAYDVLAEPPAVDKSAIAVVGSSYGAIWRRS